MTVYKIAHIINPVKTDSDSDLYRAQPVTFESMRRAREFAQNKVDVELYTAQYKEDKAIIPEFFIQTPDLNRSVLDIGQFNQARKLPLIGDILSRLNTAASNADYLIYTNVDIALQPHFYTTIKHFIEQGYDSFVINRRTIPKELNTIEQLPEMYAHEGQPHPGYDCFVFKKELYEKLSLENICVGARYVGKAMVDNLKMLSLNFKIFESEKLTFHIGNDRIWDRKNNSGFNGHNKKYYEICMNSLKRNFGLVNVKIGNEALFKEIKKKRLLFTVTTGRSGTGLLAELCSANSRVKAFHEPEPMFKEIFPELRNDKTAAKRFLLKRKLPFIAEQPSNIYIETSHLFCKGFLEELLKMGIHPELILLRRSEREVAKSMFQLQTIPGRTDKGKQYYLSPEDNNIFLHLPDCQMYNDYQLCFWYALEIRKRQEFYNKYYQFINLKTYQLQFEDMLNPKSFLTFLKMIQLPLKSPLFKKRFQKINEKKKQKKQFPYSDGELFLLETEVINKCTPFTI